MDKTYLLRLVKKVFFLIILGVVLYGITMTVDAYFEPDISANLAVNTASGRAEDFNISRAYDKTKNTVMNLCFYGGYFIMLSVAITMFYDDAKKLFVTATK